MKVCASELFAKPASIDHSNDAAVLMDKFGSTILTSQQSLNAKIPFLMSKLTFFHLAVI